MIITGVVLGLQQIVERQREGRSLGCQIDLRRGDDPLVGCAAGSIIPASRRPFILSVIQAVGRTMAGVCRPASAQVPQAVAITECVRDRKPAQAGLEVHSEDWAGRTPE